MNVSPVGIARYFFPDEMGPAAPVLTVGKVGPRSFEVRAQLPALDADGSELTGGFGELQVACLLEVEKMIDPWPSVVPETMLTDAERASDQTGTVSLVGAQPGEVRSVLFEDMVPGQAYWLYAVVTDNT